MDSKQPAMQGSTALIPTDKKRSFQIYKRTEQEKSRSLDIFRLSNYVRDFDEEWNDVEDILQHRAVGQENCEKISYIMVKGKDWNWRWIPAESVNPDLIDAYLKERDDFASPSLMTPEMASPDTSIIVWKVRQGSRRQMPLSERILEIASFNDVGAANHYAERRLSNNCSGKTIKTWKRYRFGDRFIGYVSNSKSIEDDIFVWVEKEIRDVPTASSKENAGEASSSTGRTVMTPDTTDTYPNITEYSYSNRQELNPNTLERVQDGRDFFETLKSKKLQVDTLIDAGSKSNPILPQRIYWAWIDWIQEWNNARHKSVKDAQAEKEIVYTLVSSLEGSSIDSDADVVVCWELEEESVQGEWEFVVEDSGSDNEDTFLTPTSSVFGGDGE